MLKARDITRWMTCKTVSEKDYINVTFDSLSCSALVVRSRASTDFHFQVWSRLILSLSRLENGYTCFTYWIKFCFFFFFFCTDFYSQVGVG